MKKTLVALLCLFLVPKVAAAQASVQSFLKGIMLFLNSTVIPLLIALAFLFFLINVVRYFIIGGANEDAREKARSLALWGIIAFVLMVSIWGIVNFIVDELGIDFQGQAPPCPDFLSVAACIELQGQPVNPF